MSSEGPLSGRRSIRLCCPYIGSSPTFYISNCILTLPTQHITFIVLVVKDKVGHVWFGHPFYLLFFVNYMTVRLLLTHNKSLFLLLVYCKPSKQTIQNICFKTHYTVRAHRKLCLWHLVWSCLMHQSAVMLYYVHK